MSVRTSLPANEKLSIGQRVYSGLYGGRYGIVFQIHGEQRPESIGRIAGVMSYGGHAELDVVFDAGTISRMVPESVVRGVQWEIFDEVASPEEIAKAIHHAEHEEARRKTREREATERRARERAEHAAKNPHLIKKADKPDWSNGRIAAANIRRELKDAFKTTKFKVTSDHNSVRVCWENGPTREEVEAIAGKYKAGHFNGMEDIYENNHDATFADVFGNPGYVFCERNYTMAGLKEAWIKDGNSADGIDWDAWATMFYDHSSLQRHIRDAWNKTNLEAK